MPDPNLPKHVSPNLAAALCGYSPRHVRYLVRAGLLMATATVGGHIRIELGEVEKMRRAGPITATEYLAAKRQLDRTLGIYNAAYNARRTTAKPLNRGGYLVVHGELY